jgi:antibiotic biosynthesis monooxygenase (ABM) superfamily enzyme
VTPPENSEAAFEYVFEQEVRASRVEGFLALSERLHALASRQPGFIHQERRPIEQTAEIVRFETTLRFDTAAHCIDWLDHPERRRLLNLEEEQAGFTFRGHGNWEGYSRWLSSRVTTEPPKWKVNLLVLLTLYPTAMLLTPLLHRVFQGFGMPSLMLISNVLCVAATSWVLVPFVSRFYLRWLEGESPPRARLFAVASLLALLAILLAVFQSLPVSLWG